MITRRNQYYCCHVIVIIIIIIVIFARRIAESGTCHPESDRGPTGSTILELDPAQ